MRIELCVTTATGEACGSCDRPKKSELSDYSLIGSGWRLLRVPLINGQVRLQWCCPECWRVSGKYRIRQAG